MSRSNFRITRRMTINGYWVHSIRSCERTVLFKSVQPQIYFLWGIISLSVHYLSLLRCELSSNLFQSGPSCCETLPDLFEISSRNTNSLQRTLCANHSNVISSFKFMNSHGKIYRRSELKFLVLFSRFICENMFDEETSLSGHWLSWKNLWLLYLFRLAINHGYPN